MRLSGKRIFISAAAQGIGRASALACANEGAHDHIWGVTHKYGAYFFIARIAINIGISLRARFSALAFGPESLTRCEVHSSMASIAKPAFASSRTYAASGR